MTKEELLKELQEETYVTLRPSPTHGIGVFALRDIPAGCRSIFAKDNSGWIKLSFEEVDKLPDHSKDFIETYYLYDETHYFIPDHGCKIMDMASYLNHSSEPNLISVNDGSCFEANRIIRKGEELLIDYGSIVNEGVDGY